MKDSFKELIQLNLIPLFFGPPGIGKTTTASKVAEELNLEFRDILLSQYQGIDIGGFPYVDNGKGKYAHFGDILFPLEDTILPENKEGWLVFLDEITNAEEDTLKVLLRILNEYKLGDKKIHPKVKFMLAGNPKGTGSMGYHLPDALIDRTVVFEAGYSSRNWLKWAKSPEGKQANINKGLILFWENAYFDDEDMGPYERDKPFISPRSLGQLSIYLNGGGKNLSVIQSIAGKKFIKKNDMLLKFTLSLPTDLYSWYDVLYYNSRIEDVLYKIMLPLNTVGTLSVDTVLKNIKWFTEYFVVSEQFVYDILEQYCGHKNNDTSSTRRL